jgi:hypothetical protein
MLQTSRRTLIRGENCKAVAAYREFLTTYEMAYSRLSRKVKSGLNFYDVLQCTLSAFHRMPMNTPKSIALFLFSMLFDLFLVPVEVNLRV